MSEASRKAWLDAWESLTIARQAFGMAKGCREQREALRDMQRLAHVFVVAAAAYEESLASEHSMAKG